MKIHHATKAKAAKFKITLTVEDNEVVATGKDGTRLAAGLQGNKVLEDAITRQTGKPAKGIVKTRLGQLGTSVIIKTTRKAGKPGAVASAPQSGHKYTKLFSTWTPAQLDEEIAGQAEILAEDDDVSVKAAAAEIRKMFQTDLDAFVELLGDRVEKLLEDEADDDDSDADQSKSIVKAKYKAKYKPTKDKCGDELSFRIHDHVSREDDAGELKVVLDLLRNFAKANECWVPAYAGLKSRTGSWNAGQARMNVGNRLRARLRRIAKEQERPFNIDKDIVWN